MNNNIIKIHLKDAFSYKNIYNDEILSYELSNYILEEIKGKKLRGNIKFIITSAFLMSSEEKEVFVDMIRNNFGADISEMMNIQEKLRIANGLVFLIGLFLLLIYSLFEMAFISEFILIFCWIFVGESVCNFMYKELEYRYKVKRRKQIVNAKVIFEETN